MYSLYGFFVARSLIRCFEKIAFHPLARSLSCTLLFCSFLLPWDFEISRNKIGKIHKFELRVKSTRLGIEIVASLTQTCLRAVR